MNIIVNVRAYTLVKMITAPGIILYSLNYFSPNRVVMDIFNAFEDIAVTFDYVAPKPPLPDIARIAIFLSEFNAVG